MSAETDFVRHFIELRHAFDVDPQYDPRATGLTGKMQLGLEITVVESNLAYAFHDEAGTFHTTLAPGQKSYIRSPASALLETATGVSVGPSGTPVPFTTFTGLSFTSPIRWYAYVPAPDPRRERWGTDTPFGHPGTPLTNITISLVPFHSEPGVLPMSDDRVHVSVLRTDGRSVTLNDITHDRATQQLRGYGPRMEASDNASLWVLSFFFTVRPPK